MDLLDARVGLQKPFWGRKLTLLWIWIVLIHIALVGLLVSKPTLFPKWANTGKQESQIIYTLEAPPSMVAPLLQQSFNMSHSELANSSIILGDPTIQDVKVVHNGNDVVSHSTPKPEAVKGMCDFAKGKWVNTGDGPLYTNNTCKYIQENQNCMKNGHPTDALFWRWKPDDCSLPRFDARLFLQSVRGKVWGFVGDSLARNQMQSLLCMISQVEEPIVKYEDRPKANAHWYFKSYNFTLIVLWSPYLVGSTVEEFKNVSSGMLKLHLDVLDGKWAEAVPSMDVIVLSTGPWLMKPAVYIMGNEVVGCHSCDNKALQIKEIDFTYAFQTVLRNALALINQKRDFKGIAFVRTYSMGHYEHGNWDTGGRCNSTVPYNDENQITLPFYKIQAKNDLYRIAIEEVNNATSQNDAPNSSRIRLLDVTYMTILRGDGHPGKYRGAKVKGEENSPNDCLHWCLPGPIDAWNDILFQLMRPSFGLN